MALADPSTGEVGQLPAIFPTPPSFFPPPENLRVDPGTGQSGTAPASGPVVTTMTPSGPVQGPVYDTTPWYVPTLGSPAPAAPAAAVAATGPGVAGPAAPFNPPPFAGQDFPAIQSPGAFVAPVGGFSARPAAGFGGGGLLSVNVQGGAWSSSGGREQLAAMPYAPHFGIRPGLGGIGRVLAGLGIAGHHRLPRWLEDAATERTPLTP